MNRTDAKALLPIITAFANGKKIQFKANGSGVWEDSENPAFLYGAASYRIKPEIKQVKAWLIISRSTGRALRDPGECSTFYSKENAEYRRSRTTCPDEWVVVELSGNYER